MMGFINDWKRKRKIAAHRKSRQNKFDINWDTMFNSLDDETRQETALRYLRAIDNISLKRLYEAVDLYRKADKILKEKVKDPEPEQDETSDLTLEPVVATPTRKEKDEDGNKRKSDTGKTDKNKS